MLLALGTMPAWAQTVTTHSTEKELKVEYQVPLVRPTSNYANTVTPMLCTAQGDTLRLDPVTVRGAANARKLHRQCRLKGLTEPAYTRAKDMPTMAGGSISLPFTQYPWARQPLTLCVLTEREGCCHIETLSQTCGESFRWKNPYVPVIRLVQDNTGRAGDLEKTHPVLQHVSKYRPYDDTRILRKELGALYVYFPLDRTELRREFRDNAGKLDKIVDITRQITADTTSSVEKIQIIGLASIEGKYEHNAELGQGRGDALKEYIKRELSLPDTLFDVANGAEAWTEFRDQLNDAPQFEGKDEVLALIDDETDLDRREARIKQLNGGRTYQYIKENILADQRNSGYVRIFWDYVPDQAAQSINTASQMVKDKQYSQAIRVLRTVQHDPRAWNALATALYMDGQEEEALTWYRKAAAQGDLQAQENLKGIAGQAQ